MGALVFIDSAAHPSAQHYYTRGRHEPTTRGHHIEVSRVVAQRGITLEAILTEIASSARAGDSVIIVSHGREAGLSLRVVARREARGRHEILNALRNDRPTSVEGIRLPAVSDEEAAQRIGNRFDAATVARLRGLMHQVQAKRLEHVALRACNVGSYEDAMESYRAFFGARSLSAPRAIRDTFGSLTPEITRDAADAARWRRGHSQPLPPYSYGRVELWMGSERNHSYQIRMRADSAQAVQQWAQRWLAGGAPYRSGRLHYHGFYRTMPGPAQPGVVFPGDPAFYDFLGYAGAQPAPAGQPARRQAQPQQAGAGLRRWAATPSPGLVMAVQRSAGNRAAAQVAAGALELPAAWAGGPPARAPGAPAPQAAQQAQPAESRER